jgi:hypothetical protein
MDFIVLFSFNSVAPQQLNPPREYPTTLFPSPDSDKALISANLPELLAVPEQISFTRYLDVTLPATCERSINHLPSQILSIQHL